MMTRYRAALDGIQLDSIDPAIYILDISEESPRYKVYTAERAGMDGTHVTGVKRQYVRVEVSFAIRLRNTIKRQAVLDKVAAWCQGHTLTTSTRQMGGAVPLCLHAECTQWPSIESALKWTDAVTVAFTAYEVPFWQLMKPKLYAEVPAAQPVTMRVKGSAGAVVGADVRYTGADPLETITLSVGAVRMTLNDLNMVEGETLHIAHDDAGRLSITIQNEEGTRSAYRCLSPDSPDDIILPMGDSRAVIQDAENLCVKWSQRDRWR